MALFSRNYDLYKSAPADNIREIIDRAAASYADKPAFCIFGENGSVSSVTYTELRENVASMGAYFASRGFGKGSKIALVGENRYEWVLAYLAVVNIGATVMPLDKELAHEDMAGLIRGAGADLVLHTSAYEEAAGVIAAAAEPRIQQLCIDGGSLAEVLEKGRSRYKKNPALYEGVLLSDRDNPAVILFTSGTTGTSKGVMLSHRNIATNVWAASSMVYFTQKDTVLSVLPMNHAYELTCGILSPLHCGCTVYINDSMKHLLRNISATKPTGMFVVPLILETIFKKIMLEARRTGQENKMKLAAMALKAPLLIGRDFRPQVFSKIHRMLGGRLFKIVCGGAPLDPRIVAGFRDFGITVLQGYGITECSPLVAVNRNDWHKDAAVGLPVPGTEVSIRDGEICVRGPGVMLGYYNNRQANEDAFDDGWFRTGDIGYFDRDGFLYVSGRRKNLIISTGGKNIVPEEIEERLLRCGAVKEVVVYGMERGSEIIVAAEILPDLELLREEGKDPAAEVDATVRRVNAQLPSYKQIRYHALRDSEFEKTTTKKIKRRPRTN